MALDTFPPNGMPLLRKWLRQFIVETIGHMILNNIFPCSQCVMLMHWAISWCIFNYKLQIMRATAIIISSLNVCGRWFGTFSMQCLVHLWSVDEGAAGRGATPSAAGVCSESAEMLSAPIEFANLFLQAGFFKTAFGASTHEQEIRYL